MRRALIALALGAIILGASVLCVLAFEPWIGRTVAFWPGFVVQRLLKLVGISVTNGVVFLSTLLFWWLAVWLALRFWLPGPPVFSNSAALICPFCKHQFPLTWRRYWKGTFGRHVCPSCGRSSKLRTGLLYWALYVPLLTITPFAALSFVLVVYRLVVPRHFEEDVTWFLGSPWLVATLITLWAFLFPIDRMIDARFRKLHVPKGGKNAV